MPGYFKYWSVSFALGRTVNLWCHNGGNLVMFKQQLLQLCVNVRETALKAIYSDSAAD